MTRSEIFQILAFDRVDNGRLRFQFRRRGHRTKQCFCNEHPFSPQLHDHIIDCGVYRDRLIGRNGPRGGGPDDNVEWLVSRKIELGRFCGRDRKLHPDRNGSVVLVFDFRLGQRGFKGNGPVDGFLTAIDNALIHEGGKGAQNIAFEIGRFCFIFIGPITQHTDPLELCFLDLDPFLGKRITTSPHFRRRQIEVLLTNFLNNFLFDGQTVTVPARHVRRAMSGHGLVAVDRILQGFIQGRADMHVAIGERRSVVQDENLGALCALALNGGIQI